MFSYYCIFNGQARRRPNPKGRRGVPGGQGGRQALRACGRAAGRRAAILSPWLLSLWGGGGGGAQARAIAPTARDVEAAREQGCGDPQLLLGPDVGGFPPLPTA